MSAGLEELQATVARMETRLSAHQDSSVRELWRVYQDLVSRYQRDLGESPRDVALAKSSALMVLQGLEQARAGVSAIVNIDVGDLAAAIGFYCEALGLRVGRRFGEDAVELLGGGPAIYLLVKPAGSAAAGSMRQQRDYGRHWTPVHLDFVVPDVRKAVERARVAGAVLEADIGTYKWGHLALMADPFGHGFCLIQFLGRGYDEIASS